VDIDIRDDDSSLLELASLIDEGKPIDWDTETGARRNESERAVLEELRLLARLTTVYRDPDAVADAGANATIIDEPAHWSWASLTVFEQIGRGGSAKVFRARDGLGRNVALKLFPVTKDNASALAARVLREGSLLAKVRHQNVVIVHGVERAGDFAGLWMEFINGRTLDDELRARGPLSADEAIPIGVDLCRALAAVHGEGLVHRDVKAQNVMREHGGRTVLMDFGCGTELATGVRRPEDMAGTPIYLAPELFDGRAATPASDIYSLGVLLYRLVTRGYPVDGADRAEIEDSHRKGRIRRLRDARPDLPSAFVEAVERALSPNPNDRPQTAGAFEAMLRRADPPREWWRYAAAAAAIAVMVGVPVFLMTAGTSNQPGSTTDARTLPTAPPAVNVPQTSAATAADYTVKAVLFRDRDGVETPLTKATTLRENDHLGMTIEASRPVYAYVINADDSERSYRLFPLPEHKLDNPLDASAIHRLPGPNDNWTVTNEGGREHFVVIVSPTKDAAIDTVARMLPPVSNADQVERALIPTRSLEVLRSVGRLASRKAPPQPSGPKPPWFDGAEELTGNVERANGAWIRRLTVPGRAPGK
jgi:serine/threonine-protein kinase